MSTFVNTVDSVGDQALTDSIIDRSITELHCNLTASIRQYAFRACTALTNVNFPSVTSVALGAFWSCTALTKADFASTVAFANNAFYGCSALSAVILRNADAVSTITGTPFDNSAIASGTGYIYVPSALVETYKTNWATYAAQIRAIEDYPEVCDPYSWETVFKTIDNGTYKDYYKVGDLVPLDLGSEGVVNMQIAGFDVDDKADGSGKAPITWISKELLATRRRMNPALVTNADGTYQQGTGFVGGWEACELREKLQSVIKPLIPDGVRGRLLSVAKEQRTHTVDFKDDNLIQTTYDDVWVPSYSEATLNGKYGNLFPNNAARLKRIPNVSTGNYLWCLRDVFEYMNHECFMYVSADGSINTSYDSYMKCTYTKRIALGFCT